MLKQIKRQNYLITYLKQTFYKNSSYKKNQIIASIVLLGEKTNDKVYTEYTVIT